MNSWALHYVLGAFLFGIGMGAAYGWIGVPITAGVVMMLGGFGHFILGKIQTMIAVSSQERS